jgi:hypothetical protein
MAVRIVPARIPDPPIDRLVWRLVKAQRTAQGVVRLIPRAGLALRIEVDHELHWSRCYGWNTGELDAESERKRGALRQHGWSDVDAVRQM